MSHMSTVTQKTYFCLTISTRRGTSPSAVDGEWPSASWGRDARVSKPALGLEFDSGSGTSRSSIPHLAVIPRILIMPLCLCVSAGRLTMISSVITYRASPCGVGAPSGAILMALGALLPFSIIMWTTGATAQSKTLQVCDEEGASIFSLLLHPLLRAI